MRNRRRLTDGRSVSPLFSALFLHLMPRSPWINLWVNLVIWYGCNLVLSYSFDCALTKSTSLNTWRDCLNNWCLVNLIVIWMTKALNILFYDFEFIIRKSQFEFKILFLKDYLLGSIPCWVRYYINNRSQYCEIQILELHNLNQIQSVMSPNKFN